MCIAKSIVSNMIDLIDVINKEYKTLSEQLSNHDLMEQDVLHRIESSSFNACEGYHLAKNLQKIRKQRRVIKNELPTMDSLKQSLNIKQLKSQFESALRQISVVENRIGQEYHPRILKGDEPTAALSDLQKLRSVNKTDLKFKSTPELDRVNELLKQVN